MDAVMAIYENAKLGADGLLQMDSKSQLMESNTMGGLDTQVGSLQIGDYWHDHWYPYVEHHWNSYPVYHTIEKNKTEQAFKVVNVFFKKGVVKCKTVKDFVDLVTEIAKEL